MVNDEIISLSPLYYLSSYAFLILIPNSFPNPNSSSLFQFSIFSPYSISCYHHHLLLYSPNSPSNYGSSLLSRLGMFSLDLILIISCDDRIVYSLFFLKFVFFCVYTFLVLV